MVEKGTGKIGDPFEIFSEIVVKFNSGSLAIMALRPGIVKSPNTSGTSESSKIAGSPSMIPVD